MNDYDRGYNDAVKHLTDALMYDAGIVIDRIPKATSKYGRCSQTGSVWGPGVAEELIYTARIMATIADNMRFITSAIRKRKRKKRLTE